MVQILDFEREIFALEKQIHDLVSLSHMYDSVGDITEEISKLKKKLRKMKHDVYSNLKGWDKTMVARHPDRPHMLDYIQYIFSDFFDAVITFKSMSSSKDILKISLSETNE